MENEASLTRALRSAGSADRARQLVSFLIRSIGFDGMTFADPVCRLTPRLRSVLCGHAPSVDIDLLLRRALRSSLPLAWDTREMHDFAGLAQLHAAGIGSGLLVVVRRNLGSAEHAVVSLLSKRESADWIDETTIAQSLLFAHCLCDWVSERSHEPELAAGGALASPTRREILNHLVQGRSNKQIAYTLHLSAETVKYHTRELRRHFKVRNRVELVTSHLLQR
jgi:DNA-binding CsgD family transcriptional regulator